MVSTDTLDRGGYMGGRCVALTWSSEIDGRPDWPSDHMPAPWPDVWFESEGVWGCRLGFIAKPRLGLSESYRRVIGDLSRCYRNAPGGSPNPRLSPLGGRNGARIARTIADIATENVGWTLTHLLFLA